MSVKIVFTGGGLAGTVAEVPVGGTLSIGRSHTCDVRAAEGDVSARHLLFRLGVGGTATVEVQSSRKTLFNGTSVSLGNTFAVKDGDTFQCGGTVACRVECVADEEDSDKTIPPGDKATVPPPVKKEKMPLSDDRATIPPRPAAVAVASGEKPVSLASNDDPNATIAIQTRIASDEEMDEIKRLYSGRRIRRMMSVIIPSILFLAAAVGAWIWFSPKTEEFVSWPEDAKGRSMDRNVLVAPYLAMTVPDSSACRVEKGDGNIEIATFAGIQHDVPMHFQALTSSDTNSLTVGRERAFDGWLRNRRVEDSSFNPSTDRRKLWVCKSTGNGVPVNYVSYTRRIGEEDWYGYLLYLRFEDTTHVVFAEVLLKDRWRADPLLRCNLDSFVRFAPRRAYEAWEGYDSIRPGDCPKCDLDEAERYFSPDGKLAAAYWDAVWYRVRSALVKAKKGEKVKMLERARKLLVRMRAAQSDWYAEQRNAWNQADRIGDERTKQALQSSAETAFSEDFRNCDYRYDCIKRKEWK
ncbi:MAG: FHA domain-containing protein [Kiritimatiellae bacterium]|nr:FHA domain-containing protein [Kiritimatiellia bacterium]